MKLPVFVALLLVAWSPVQAGIPVDPYGSPMWAYNIERYLGNIGSVVLDEQVQVKVPPFAENSAQVPLTVDLSAFLRPVSQIVAWVDLNPIPHLFSLTPGPTPTTLVSMNFRVQQATTVRVAVLDNDGTWHLGSAYVDAAGGGCTAPSMTAANPDWERNFGTIRGGAFSRVDGVRYKFSVMHPMDSGMVDGVPIFHIENVVLRDSASDSPLLTMELSESAAENPMLVFELARQTPDAVLWMRDNNGNEFERRLGGGGMMPRVLVATLFWLICAPAVSAPELTYKLDAREVVPGTWVVEGSTGNFSRDNGGNIVNVSFVITGDGVVVIDTGPSRLYGEALRQLIESKTSEPISHVLITHHHPDHAFGNQAFDPGTLYMLESSRQLLHQDGDAFADNMYRLVGDWMRGTQVVVPPNALQPGILDVGGHRFQLLELSGHTGADLVIFDETSGVLFASDMVFYNRALTTPQSPGLMVWAGELTRLEELPYRVLVPGHGPVVSDDSAFRQMSDYLAWLYQTLSTSASRGLSASEVMQTAVPHRFDGVEGAGYELIRTTTHLYPKYEQAALQLLPE